MPNTTDADALVTVQPATPAPAGEPIPPPPTELQWIPTITHPAPTAEQLAKAEQLRKAAADSRRAAEDSFQRCDTDGFLSQWASNLTAQEHAAQAEILEHGGCAKFLGLFDSVTGERVPAKIISGDYGARWMLCDATTGKALGIFYSVGRVGDNGLPVNSPRTKLAKAGLEERIEWAPAVAKVVGHGRGLSGSAWVATLRTDGGWPGAPQWRVVEDSATGERY